jgi:predicted nucleic acid-binding protein
MKSTQPPSAVALDFSAFARVLLAYARPSSGRRLDRRTLAEFDDGLRTGRLHATTPFRIETLYSTRATIEFESMSGRLDSFATVEGDANTWLIAERSQRELAEDPAVSHRISMPDLLLATSASQQGLGVLHYDSDYDLLAEHTSLEFESVWIAPPGSVD